MPESKKIKEKKYPTEPDKEGFYFKNADEETSGILTKDYENGSSVKKVMVSNGQTAIIRKLKGRDMVETKKSHSE